MLMLSRHVGESVLIGHELVVTISAMDAAQVRFDVVGRRLGGPLDGEPFTQSITLPNKAGELLELGESVRLEILNHTGEKLRVGVYHPRSLSVHRKEVWDAMEKSKKDGQ